MIRRYVFWTMTYLFIILTAYKVYQMRYLGGIIPLDNFQFVVFSLAAASLSINMIMRSMVINLTYIIREISKTKREP